MARVSNPVVIHWTLDMTRATAFYEAVLGLDVLTRGEELSVLDLPPVQLVLHAVHEEDPERPLAHAGLNVEVADLDAGLDLVRAHGGEVLRVREPAPPVSLRVAMCRDPDGNGFELRQRVGSA